jgi:hypothetical protein
MLDIIREFVKILGKPDFWSRIFRGLVLICIGLLIFLWYESYSQSFYIARLQKETALLAQLQEIEAKGTNRVPELQRMQKDLMEQTLKTVESVPVRLTPAFANLKPTSHWVWKFLAGGALWIFSALAELRNWSKPGTLKEVMGNLGVAILAGFVGLFIPSVWWPWFHIAIYPLIFTVISAVTLFPIAMGLRRAKARAKLISCTNNLKQIGVAARIYAGIHGGKYPRDFQSMSAEIGDNRILCCPESGSMEYEILASDLNETQPSRPFVKCPVHNSVLFVNGSVRPGD